MRTADFLRSVPVLAGLSEEHLERIAAQASEVRMPADRWIFREGEPASSMFIVRSGQVEVIDEGPPETFVRTLRRGAVLGELALLVSGTRSASVRARRATELLELSRADFEAVIEQAPGFALSLTRAMGAQLAASRATVENSTPPRTIAVVGLDPGAPADEVAERLAGALASHGSVARLSEGGLAEIERAEQSADRTVLTGTEPQWRELCLAEAELIVAVTCGVPDARWLAETRTLHGCELLVAGRSVGDAVLKKLQPRQVQLVEPSRLGPALEQTARRLAGRSLGIVLSGGGARALAHLGVIAELRASGLTFDRVGGTSLGALVGGAAAAGFSDDEMYAVAEHVFVDSRPSSDFVPPVYSLIRGGRVRRHIHETFGDRRIEQLPARYFCMSCDLVAREPVMHASGELADAIYASLALPGVFPPMARDGRLLVDGGVLDNLPVAAMGRAAEGPVVAVDVTGRPNGRRGVHRTALSRSLLRTLTGSDAEIPRLGETLVRTLTVGSSDTVEAARLHADAVVTPRVEAIGFMDWKALPRAVELGRQAAREALAADPGLIDRLRS